MPSDKTLEIVQKATVTLLRKGGQGILVYSNIILTAAHCIDFSTEGQMMLGEHFLEDILTVNGQISATTIAVEPVSDIAVLGPPIILDGSLQLSNYYDFSETINPIPLCNDDYVTHRPFTVYVYTHKAKWITGKATLDHKDNVVLSIDFDEQIEPGTSGSAIVNDEGELVGIVSDASLNNQHTRSDGLAPRPNLTLPVWIYKKILEDQLNYPAGAKQ